MQLSPLTCACWSMAGFQSLQARRSGNTQEGVSAVPHWQSTARRYMSSSTEDDTIGV